MRGAGVLKACRVGAGVYELEGAVVLDGRDVGERFIGEGAWPVTGAAKVSPELHEAGAFAMFVVMPGANEVAIEGFRAVGFEAVQHSSCTGAHFLMSEAGAYGEVSGLRVEHNTLERFDCAITVSFTEHSSVSHNYIRNVSYLGIGCSPCRDGAWEGNVVYEVNAFGEPGHNAYGLSVSYGGGTVPPLRVRMVGNACIYNATWQCFDAHSGEEIEFVGNLAVHGFKGGNAAVSVGTGPVGQAVRDVVVDGNVIDHGTSGHYSTVVICGHSCDTNQYLAGVSHIRNNWLLIGRDNGCGLGSVSPPPGVVMEHNNGGAGTSCSGLDTETVAAVDFDGSVEAAFAARRPGSPVAHLQVHMSAAYWQFPQPPGELAVGGANLGGFVMCEDGASVCQGPGGVAPGVYEDFTVTATLRGMRGSPVVVPAGVLRLVGY
jgi:hypothetical protein